MLRKWGLEYYPIYKLWVISVSAANIMSPEDMKVSLKREENCKNHVVAVDSVRCKTHKEESSLQLAEEVAGYWTVDQHRNEVADASENLNTSFPFYHPARLHSNFQRENRGAGRSVEAGV
jgi:hypothetical protein